MVTLTFDINKDRKNFKKARYTNEKMPIQRNAKFSTQGKSQCWQLQNFQEMRSGKKWLQNVKSTLKILWTIKFNVAKNQAWFKLCRTVQEFKQMWATYQKEKMQAGKIGKTGVGSLPSARFRGWRFQIWLAIFFPEINNL